MHVLGVARVEFSTGGSVYKQDVTVVPNFDYDAVLGLHFLIPRGAAIDLEQRQLSLRSFTRSDEDTEGTIVNNFQELAFQSVNGHLVAHPHLRCNYLRL